MQKHRGDDSPPLMHFEDRVGEARAEAVLSNSAEPPQDAEASTASGGSERHPAHAEHYDVGDQQRRSYGSFVLAKNSGEFLAKSRERKAQARAANVATSCADADQRSASRADLRTRLITSAAAAKKSASTVLPAIQTPLPL